MIVKICGVMTYEDALMAAKAGADMLGLNFYPPSPRYLEPQAAGEIVSRLRDELGSETPKMVGVFVNESAKSVAEIIDIAGLDYAQLSGDETIETVMALSDKAFAALRPDSLDVANSKVKEFESGFTSDVNMPSALVDAYHPKLFGGTGDVASVEIALAVKKAVPRLMLAGGLNPENVGERVAALQPWGVDVASGVEKDGQKGVKDPAKVAAFVQLAKAHQDRYSQ